MTVKQTPEGLIKVLIKLFQKFAAGGKWLQDGHQGS